MTATMISAVSSRTVCWLPALVSAFTAAEPVTALASPAGALPAGPAMASRMACTASRSVLPEPACPVMFTRERHGLAVGRRLRRSGRGEAGDVAGEACHGAAGRGDHGLVG